MDLAVADLLEQEEKKANERKRQHASRPQQTDDDDFIAVSSNGGLTESFENKHRLTSPTGLPKGDLFGGRRGSANRLKYEDGDHLPHGKKYDEEKQSSPNTPARDTSERKSHRLRDDTRGASDADSANGSVRSSRRHRSRSPSTGPHSRRERDHYRSRNDDRYRSSRHEDSDRSYRPRHEGGRDYKRRLSVDHDDDVDMTGAPPKSRPRHDRSPPRGGRSGHSHDTDRYRRHDDRNHGSRRDTGGRNSDRYRDDRREPERRKSPDPVGEERDLRTVFCRQLSLRLRTHQLKEFFEKNVGPVQEVQIVKDRVSGRSKGVAYVEFKDKENLEKALGLTGKKLLDVPMIVQLSDAEKNRQAKANEGMTSSNNNGQPYHKLYVGNILFSVTEEDLASMFDAFGPLEHVQLQRDDLGRSKGYGFVLYTNHKDAQGALEGMNGVMLYGRPMRVGLGTTDKTQETQDNLRPQAPESGSAFSGAGGRGGGYGSSAKEEQKGQGASALDDNDVNGVSLGNVNRHELMRKLARLDDPNEKKEDSIVRSTKPVVAKVDPTRCVCLAGMWSAKTTATKGWQAETEEDVRQECNDKYGIVKHVAIDPNSQFGEVYVKFDRAQGGENAYRGLNGRYFDGQRITCKYVVDAVYNIMFPKAANV